ncbi:MAG TPA: MBL fold metallo-hydrolase [Solirubrobacteraceae bacterium]|nr:MBL fold metallo-hydrolase [Solirubrobacteraceae bacterium]
MREVAPEVHQLAGFPPNAINVYLAGDVLIDAGTRLARRRIMRELRRRALSAHALTHAHPDHQGASRAVCVAYGVGLACGAADAAAVEDPRLITAGLGSPAMRAVQSWAAGPPQRVSRALREGEHVADFEVIDTPGHSAGHVAYFRARDRTLIIGDVLTNVDLRTGVPGLHEPPAQFTRDPARNRASARRLAELRPAVVLFGHGAPLRDPGRFADFIAALPA